MTGTVELVITEKCNLRCKYCYMSHDPLSLTTKSIPYIARSFDRLSKAYNTDSIHVSYFGGEPLLEWDLLKEIHINVVSKHPLVKSYNIISNGLLIDEEKVQWIKSNNIGFSLSFDGIASDISRPQVDNQTTFDKYMQLKPLLKQLTTGAKVMISPHNVHLMYDNFLFFIEKWECNFPDFSLVRDDVWDDKSIEMFEQQSKAIANYVVKRIKQNKPLALPGFFSLWIADIFVSKYLYKKKRPFGCFALYKGWAYYIDDICYPCARFASHKRLPIYDAKEDKFLMPQSTIDHYRQLVSTYNVNDCKQCSLYQSCNMGCTFNQLDEKNDTFKPVKSICKLYSIIVKILYNDLLPHLANNHIKQVLRLYNIGG